MSLRELIETGRLQYVALWALAIACFGLSLAGRTVLGFGPDSLLVLGVVFAAVTAEYSDGAVCASGFVERLRG